MRRLVLGNGNSDIFGAITFAMELLFRPGVSKNFILMPCSECKDYNMKVRTTRVRIDGESQFGVGTVTPACGSECIGPIFKIVNRSRTCRVQNDQVKSMQP
jgi:hypothetical protein